MSSASALLTHIEFALAPYVTSSFSQHGLLAVITIASRVIGGVLMLAIGKLINIRSRNEGFMGAIVMVMKALCQNVETYAAAQVFYYLGQATIAFVADVFVSDITTLRNRSLILTINNTPNIATMFAGSRIAEIFFFQYNFR